MYTFSYGDKVRLGGTIPKIYLDKYPNSIWEISKIRGNNDIEITYKDNLLYTCSKHIELYEKPKPITLEEFLNESI